MNTLLFLGGGLWIIPFLTLLGSAFFLIKSIMASKSGSERYDRNTGRMVPVSGNVPFWKVNSFKYSAVLLVITIIIFFMMRSDR